MSKTLTINDIAKIANVSRGTVDRVVNNRGYVSEEKRIKIQNIIDERNFIPNAHGRNLSLNKTSKIAILIPEHSAGDYWDPLIKGTVAAAENYLHLGLKVDYFSFNLLDPLSFKNVEKDFFDNKYDALITSQPQNKQLKLFLSKCKKNKIPFVLVGSNDSKHGSLSNLGQDAMQSGRLAGKLIHFGQSKSLDLKYVIFNIYNEENINSNVVERIRGFTHFFNEQQFFQPKIEIVEISINDLKISEKISKKINQLNDNDGIFIPNSKSHYIAQFLNKNTKIRFLGYDLLSANVKLLKEGVIDFLINQKPHEQGYQSVEIIYRFLATFQMPEVIVTIPAEIITKENLLIDTNEKSIL
jgi:LacI family transcriptional regulator